jgi:hypothetical protein
VPEAFDFFLWFVPLVVCLAVYLIAAVAATIGTVYLLWERLSS